MGGAGTAARSEIERIARESLGIDALHPQQLEAIELVVAGGDVLAIWATGSGKTAIYQVAAAMRPGVTVVVSPLIALQEDQRLRIEEAPRLDGAVVLNSAGGERVRQESWQRLRDGDAQHVLLAPEQLAKPEVVEGLAELEVALLVVDEAHCIAAWGHDFRPDYLLLGSVAERLGRPPIVALTATASAPVRDEIVERLGIPEASVLVGDLDRPGIALSVVRHVDDDAKRAAVVDQVAALPTPGLLYASTRAGTQRYAEALAERGLRSLVYHGGMAAKAREEVHRRFHEGDVDVVVATSAFGMGIDKPDVRFVVHADVPESIDAYFQEVGRAGRDGADATATLHYRPEDLSLRRYFATKAPSRRELASIVSAVGRRPRSRRRLADETGVSPRRLTALLSLLVDTASVRMDRDGVRARTGVDAREAVSAALDRARDRERIDESRIEMLRAYAETRRCRRRTLLEYFGQELPEPCGECDRCRAGDDDADAARAAAGEAETSAGSSGRFDLEQQVTHRSWGDGTVMSIEDDRMTVFFEHQGYKVLSLEAVEEQDLLTG
ncbi:MULTISPECIES: RecQ family ATP-dependent DNA helicase [unclassified Agrococcus]|uniref:RecQ family ATP-dependent DNA helicase n=1 Tax=unclassified Agrococcus TaxID=2615065 RepID=UPI00360CE32C